MTDNSFSRLVGVLVAPGRTFESISKRPTWAVALVALLLATTVLGWVVHQHTDYHEMTTRAMEARGREVTADQLERIVSFQERFGVYLLGFQAVVVAVVFLLFALLYWVVFRLVGSELTFKVGLSTLLHGSVPAVVYCLLAAVVLMGQGDLTYVQVTTRDFLASNLGFLAPADGGIVLRTLLTGIDFFGLWSVVLLAIGYRITARVTSATASGVAIAMWLLGLGLRVGFTWLGQGGAG